MIRIIASIVLSVLASTVGLLAASVLLDDFSINGASFLIAIGIFCLSSLILSPLILKTAMKHASYLIGGISLVTILVSLVVTSLLSDGISINGLSTWVLAALIIWIFTILASLLLPLIIFKKTLEKHKESNNA